MPGIIGIISSEPFKQDISATLENMAAPLRYKADQTLKQFHGSWYACAVIDYGPRFPFLKSAFAEKNRVLLLMEGEVFPDAAEVPHELAGNNPAIQRAEYCLYQYLEKGPKFVLNLNGIFSIAVIDQRDQSVHLYTDRFGHRLLFTAEKPNQFAFASSLRSLLRWRKDIGLYYDKQSIAEFVLFERILADRTPFTDVKRLLPGEHLTRTDSKSHKELYFEIHKQKIPEACRSWKDAADMLLEFLKRSLARRTADQSTKGLLLSGGLDSRLVMLACPKPFVAASFSASNGNLSLEGKIAAEVAKIYGINHFWLPRGTDYYAQIAHDASNVNEGLSSALTGCHSLGVHDIMEQAGLQVIMTGDRFDAAFKVFWNDYFQNPQLYSSGPVELDVRRMARILADSPMIRRIEHQDLMMLSLNNEMRDVASQVKEEVIAMLEKFCYGEIQFTPDETSEILRTLTLGGPFWQGFTTMGMLRGLSSRFVERSPFFDNEMLNLALSFPLEWALRGRIVRRAIKLASPGIARIRDVNSGLPAGLCPPWDRVIYEPRKFLFNIVRRLSKHSRQFVKLSKSNSEMKVFSSRSWLFSQNAALIHSQLYRELVEDAVSNVPQAFFNIDNLRKLLDDDLTCGQPRMWKLWHMLVSLRSFDKTWGPSAPR